MAWSNDSDRPSVLIASNAASPSRDGGFDGQLATGRTAAAFCAQVRTAVARSQARGRIAIVLTGNLRTHTSAGSKLVRQLLNELRAHLSVVYIPAYAPEANRIDWKHLAHRWA